MPYVEEMTDDELRTECRMLILKLNTMDVAITQLKEENEHLNSILNNVIKLNNKVVDIL